MRCQTRGALTDCFTREVITTLFKALETQVKKRGHSGYELVPFWPQSANALLRRLGQKGLMNKGRVQRFAAFPASEVTMLDSLTTVVSSQTIAFGVLLIGCSIVVVEAVRASKEILWGDMFMDDLDD
jgi:hypothetical protein|tara:strand:- start:33 stop:413 length:381 start_codon:yes stop_codon:yes gene_type:complete